MCDNIKNKKRWLKSIKWIIVHIVLPIVLPVIVIFLTLKFINPPSLPNIDSTVIYNTGSLDEKPGGHFKIDLKVDTTAWLMIFVINNGNTYAEDLGVEFSFLRNNKILKSQKKYIPPGLEREVKSCILKEDLFYERLNYLPSNSSIEYKFDLKNLIKSPEEFQYFVWSKSKNWSKSTKITPKYSQSLNFYSNIAYADEKISKENQSNAPMSGILIGGYDPLVMSNEIFLLLQAKNLITKDDTLEVKKIIESYKEGVLFGGINILKFNELIMNKLLSNEAITIRQANNIVEKSKNTGGILIGGYNVIILEVEILNSLLQNNKITLEEGQRVIDRSKPNGS